MITQLSSLDGPVAAVEDTDRNRIWIVEASQPSLASFDLSARELTHHVILGSTPTGIALSGDRSEVLIAFPDGRIVSVDADSPGGPTQVAAVPQILGQLAGEIIYAELVGV